MSSCHFINLSSSPLAHQASQYFWLDGIQRGIDTRVALALAFCNFIRPPGLLIQHAVTCLLSGKGGLLSMGYREGDEEISK
jgi:hypothetical protein